ncbi:MAG: hypothetical protein IBX55_23655, partial [Methyloprofundus sp.]|nr:hypothetical protein [Methyloprofundus sp.]
MIAYHHIMAHFPIALLLISTLFMLLRTLSGHPSIVALEKAVPSLLVLGLLGSVAAFILGMTLWPLEASLSSPMAKNKILFTAWAMMAWLSVTVVRIRAENNLWQSSLKWPFMLLVLIAAGLISISGALGGYLMGSPSDFSMLLKLAGWNVYQTFYSATWAIIFAAL